MRFAVRFDGSFDAVTAQLSGEGRGDLLITTLARELERNLAVLHGAVGDIGISVLANHRPGQFIAVLGQIQRHFAGCAVFSGHAPFPGAGRIGLRIGTAPQAEPANAIMNMAKIGKIRERLRANMLDLHGVKEK